MSRAAGPLPRDAARWCWSPLSACSGPREFADGEARGVEELRVSFSVSSVSACGLWELTREDKGCWRLVRLSGRYGYWEKVRERWMVNRPAVGGGRGWGIFGGMIGFGDSWGDRVLRSASFFPVDLRLFRWALDLAESIGLLGGVVVLCGSWRRRFSSRDFWVDEDRDAFSSRTSCCAFEATGVEVFREGITRWCLTWVLIEFGTERGLTDSAVCSRWFCGLFVESWTRSRVEIVYFSLKWQSLWLSRYRLERSDYCELGDFQRQDYLIIRDELRSDDLFG